jgi:hypothetical protein
MQIMGFASIPIFRLSIMQKLSSCWRKLLTTEAMWTVADILNNVRSRYFTTTGGDPNPVTAGNLDKYRLADEWLIEFIGEGRRRTNLVRWGMFTTEAWWDHPADGPGKEYQPIPDSRFPNGLLMPIRKSNKIRVIIKDIKIIIPFVIIFKN